LNPENAEIRRNVVLKQMEKYNYLSPEEADSITRLPLVLDYNKSGAAGSSDYFLVQVRKETEDILQNLATVSGQKWDPEKTD